MKGNGIKVTADITRQIASIPLQFSSVQSADIPRDSVFKALSFQLSGNVTVAYASGTPVADATSTMDRFIENISIVSNGTINIKQVSPWLIHLQNLMATGNFETRTSSAGAAAADYPSVSGGFTFGTDGQISSIRENLLVSFENVMAGAGRMNTCWDTRGLATATCQLTFNAFANILGFGNTAPIIASNNNLVVNISSIETQALAQDVKLSVWKQSTKSVNFTAAVNDFSVDIERGNFLQGLLLFARDGASGSTTTATGKVPSNSLLTNIKLVLNGTNYVQSTTFGELQQKNISRYGINAPYVSNVSLMTGAAYLDLLTPTDSSKFGALNTAQDTRQPMVDEVKLLLSTASGAAYTSTASVKIMTNTILQPVG